MNGDRQQLNLRVIRESFTAAMVSEPGSAEHHIDAARRLLSDARADASDPGLIEQIDRFVAQLDGIGAHSGEGNGS